jgi:hypothetical protein
MEKGCVLLIICAIEVNGGVRLTVRLCPRLDLYRLEAPFFEAGAQRFRNNMKYGGDGWPAKTRLYDIARNIKIRSRSRFEGLYLKTFEPPAEFKPRRGVYLVLS